MFIEPKKVHAYFKSNYTIKKSTNGWWSMKCPFCNELISRQKFAVNFTYAWTKCYVCGYHDSVVNFVCDTEGVKYHDALVIIREHAPSRINLEVEDVPLIISDIQLPHSYQPINQGKGALAERAREYLIGRGFDIKTLSRLGIGYCNEQAIDAAEDYFGYIIVPFKVRGKLVYYLGRDFINNFLRYKNPSKEKIGIGKGDVIFNEDAMSIYDEVTLTEGWTDAVTVGVSGIASLGWSLSKRQYNKLINSNCIRMVLAPDAGVDGTGISFYDKALKLALRLIDYKEIKVLDLNPYGEDADLNTIGKMEYDKLYANTEFDTFTSLTEKSMA